MKGRITEKGVAVVELMDREGISLEKALERMNAPVGRGDATRLDPAMIEQATEAFEAAMDEHDDVVGAMRAAAAVIVADTAEQIAAAQRKRVAVTINGPLWAEGMLAAAKVAEQFARGFAAAGAETGEGEHASS